jgi:hypothetical protein
MMFTLASLTGSFTEAGTSGWAAMCITTSGRWRSKSGSRPSARTSMLKNVNSLPYPRASVRWAIRPLDRSSTAITR